MKEKLLYAFGFLTALFLVRNLYVILFQLPDEALQGAVYRIFFYHLPPYFAGVTMFFAALVASVLYLWKRDFKYDTFAVSAIEVGLAFAAMNLVTGSIWARQQWGVWWTWDARLTSALITWLIYLGYLMMRDAIPEATTRAKNSSVLAIFAFVGVYITYKANVWYRMNHPAPVLTIRTGGGTIDPAMESMLYQNFLALLMLATIIVICRMRLERNQREVESLRRLVHAH